MLIYGLAATRQVTRGSHSYLVRYSRYFTRPSPPSSRLLVVSSPPRRLPHGAPFPIAPAGFSVDAAPPLADGRRLGVAERHSDRRAPLPAPRLHARGGLLRARAEPNLNSGAQQTSSLCGTADPGAARRCLLRHLLAAAARPVWVHWLQRFKLLPHRHWQYRDQTVPNGSEPEGPGGRTAVP